MDGKNNFPLDTDFPQWNFSNSRQNCRFMLNTSYSKRFWKLLPVFSWSVGHFCVLTQSGCGVVGSVGSQLSTRSHHCFKAPKITFPLTNGEVSVIMTFLAPPSMWLPTSMEMMSEREWFGETLYVIQCWMKQWSFGMSVLLWAADFRTTKLSKLQVIILFWSNSAIIRSLWLWTSFSLINRNISRVTRHAPLGSKVLLWRFACSLKYNLLLGSKFAPLELSVLLCSLPHKFFKML